MMGVQILEGDWNAEVAAGTSGGNTASKNGPSAQQRRWTAFRSWYRGGRVFDRADETLIAAATQRRPPSPGSLGRPLTPRMAPADGPQLAAPIAIEEGKSSGPLQATRKGEDATDINAASPAAAPAAAVVPSKWDGGVPTAMAASAEVVAVSDAAGGVAAWPDAGPVTPLEGMTRGQSTTPPAPPTPPAAGEGARVHVTVLKTNQQKPTRGSKSGCHEREAVVSAVAGDPETGARVTPAEDDGIDAASLAGIARWDADGDGETGDVLALMGDEQSTGGLRGTDREEGGMIAEGLPPISRESGTAAAKKLRMEARRKFLAARTVSSKQAARKASARFGTSTSKSLSTPALGSA